MTPVRLIEMLGYKTCHLALSWFKWVLAQYDTQRSSYPARNGMPLRVRLSEGVRVFSSHDFTGETMLAPSGRRSLMFSASVGEQLIFICARGTPHSSESCALSSFNVKL